MLLPSATAAPAAIPPAATASLDDLPTPPILLQGSEGPEVFQIVQGRRRHIADMDTFTHLGYRPEDILVAD